MSGFENYYEEVGHRALCTCSAPGFHPPDRHPAGRITIVPFQSGTKGSFYCPHQWLQSNKFNNHRAYGGGFQKSIIWYFSGPKALRRIYPYLPKNHSGPTFQLCDSFFGGPCFINCCSLGIIQNPASPFISISFNSICQKWAVYAFWSNSFHWT